MLRNPLFLTLPAVVATSAYAQEAPAPAPGEASIQLNAAFSTLLSGDRAAAQLAFEATLSVAPEGSKERWLALQMSQLSRELRQEDLPATADRTPLTAAFALCVEGKPLEAQAAFLLAALQYPEGSKERAFAKKLAKIAEAQEDGMTPPALVPSVGNPYEASSEESNSAGAFTMIFTGAALGIGGGVVLGIDLELDAAIALGVPLVTGTLGGAGGYAYTKLRHKGEYSFERAGAVASGALLGLGEAILINLLTEGEIANNGFLEDFLFLGSLGGTLTGVAVSELRPGDRGDAFLVFSTALWATALSAEGFGVSGPEDAANIKFPLVIGYNVGLAGGLIAAHYKPISYRRLRIVNGSGLLGTAAGALIGGIIVAAGDGNGDAEGQIALGFTMAGSIGGLTTGYLLTKKLAPQPAPQSNLPKAFQGVSLGVAQGNTPEERPMTFNARFQF